MAGIRGNFPNYFIRALKEVFWTNYQELPSVYGRFFNEYTSEKNYEEMLGMVGFGKVPVEGELETVTLQDPMEGYKTRFTHLKYGLGYQISQELLDDDMYGRVKEFPAALARSARATLEAVAADILNLGFGAGPLLADGQSLFSTAHPMKRAGGTFKNRPSTDAKLSFTSLRQGLVDLRKIHDDSDLPFLGAEDITLVVAPEDEFVAAEIIKSVERPDTANRAANALSKQRNWNLIVWDYLVWGLGEWFLVYPKQMHKLVCFVRKDIQQEVQEDIRTNSWYHLVRFRKSFGAADARGVYGTPGA